MGMIAGQPEPTVQHFSHPHLLHLSNFQPQQSLRLDSCSGCMLSISAGSWVYNCNMCNYFLHVSCAQLPQQITHPCDQTHVLSLLPIPIYPGGLFSCDACGEQGNGFSYHCGACNIDLHTACAAMPLSLNHQSHHHQLHLLFSVPYPNQGFSCDICHNLGSKQWLYRCNICEFDAHLDCAAREATAPTPAQQVQVGQPLPTTPSPSVIPQYHQGLGAPYVGIPYSQNFASNNYVNQTAPYGMPVGRSSGQVNGLLNQVRPNSSSHNLGRLLVQGLLGIPIGGFGHGRRTGGGDLLSSLGGVDLGGLTGVGNGGLDLGGVLGGGMDFGGLGIDFGGLGN
ncbi:hypothetical protein Tsubulata_033349 [Turnera subulata]|uniref:DC1 domain-containing protein n=1 Tax=Turnera subulata TaxID=218843 RepID=A0A9Q0FY39_9ROSI|nr:hypothetical protein Tsubulata_033349 [Turnera subulata]